MNKQEWIDIAVDALDKAYVPYSHFPVGACLVTKEGKLTKDLTLRTPLTAYPIVRNAQPFLKQYRKAKENLVI